jgi:hypothetical protein
VTHGLLLGEYQRDDFWVSPPAPIDRPTGRIRLGSSVAVLSSNHNSDQQVEQRVDSRAPALRVDDVQGTTHRSRFF